MEATHRRRDGAGPRACAPAWPACPASPSTARAPRDERRADRDLQRRGHRADRRAAPSSTPTTGSPCAPACTARRSSTSDLGTAEQGSVRFSPGCFTSEADIDWALRAMTGHSREQVGAHRPTTTAAAAAAAGGRSGRPPPPFRPPQRYLPASGGQLSALGLPLDSHRADLELGRLGHRVEAELVSSLTGDSL